MMFEKIEVSGSEFCSGVSSHARKSFHIFKSQCQSVGNIVDLEQFNRSKNSSVG